MITRFLPTDYQEFIHKSRYARWDDELGRREIWPETVNRYFNFFVQYLESTWNYKIPEDVLAMGSQEVLDLGVMPSMRCLMTAGKALARDNMAGFNCSYTVINNPKVWDEMLFILMCGTGVGFSVERQYIQQLPCIPETLEYSDTVIIVKDSKRGWAVALRELIAMLYSGRIPKWDVSRVRPVGARLKTMGGRSSGSTALVDLFRFVIETFKHAVGRKLNSLECHDIACKVGDCVEVGGIRRSALISLSNLSDQRMRDAKAGQWWELYPYRHMANNSVAYTEKPEVGQFMSEWLSLYMSKSGERGIFNREAARKQAMKSGRRKGYIDDDKNNPIEFGINPCSEVVLKINQCCNLSTVVARNTDSYEDLVRKVKIAAIFGTWQSLLTNFRYLSKDWKKNCEEERLLGVSITGIMDCPLINIHANNSIEVFENLKNIVITTNKELSEEFGINQSTAVTCVKPEGTCSQLVLSSSGMHPEHSRYYIRRVRVDIKDPMVEFMKAQGFPWEFDVIKPDNLIVFSFPRRAPASSVFRTDITAIEHLNFWKLVQDHFCEHKPSITVSVKESEWPEVGAWVWNHFDEMSGVSFLPYSDHSYRQAPFEEVTEPQLIEMENSMPKNVDWNKLAEYESEDFTTGSREFACTSGSCNI